MSEEKGQHDRQGPEGGGCTTSESPGPLILVTGGGTGGHVNPGLAVVAEIRRMRPGTRFVWVGTANRLEARLVPAAGIPIEFIEVSFLKGKGLWRKLKALMRLPLSLVKATRLLGRHAPDLVVGVGGYASGPVTLAASLKGIPTVILEQNARPGLTNRILGPLVDRVFVSFEETCRWFHEDKVRMYGNPVRPSLLLAEPESGREGGQGSGDGRPACHVLVIGGSQGAASLNLVLPELLREVHARGVSLEVRHSAGKGRVGEVEAAYAGAPFVGVSEYIDDMTSAYAWADFVICRSGASTVAEVTALGKPAMYVPFPAAADNHQERNARAVVDHQGGILVRDEELNQVGTVERLAALLGDRQQLAAMGDAAHKLGRPEAASRIAREILSLLEV